MKRTNVHNIEVLYGEEFIGAGDTAEANVVLPGNDEITRWASLALDAGLDKPVEVAIKLVSDEEIQQLNKLYRQMDKVTNVLSFPAEAMPSEISAETEFEFLGDIAISANKVRTEALEQNKSLTAHFAHLIMHGVLHLMGYDHITATDAVEMEQLEIRLLATMDYDNPYNEPDLGEREVSDQLKG